MSDIAVMNVDIDSNGSDGIFSFKSDNGNIHLIFTKNGKYIEKDNITGEELELDPFVVAEDIENNYKDILNKNS